MKLENLMKTLRFTRFHYASSLRGNFKDFKFEVAREKGVGDHPGTVFQL